MYLAIATSFIDFVLQRYGTEQLAIFARNLKPAEPRSAARAAFRESFHAVTEEWRGWALNVRGRPMGLGGFVVKCLSLFGRERFAAIVTFISMVPQLAYNDADADRHWPSCSTAAS